MNTLIIYWLISLPCFWVVFVAVMTVKHAWSDLPMASKVLGGVWAIIGYIADVVLNFTVFAVLFIEVPRELTITARCGRLKRTGNAYQKWLANWLCSNLLDPFEKGGHCR